MGGAGVDTLIGGFGNDSLQGGAGNDVFKFITAGEGMDSITDFTSGSDRIEVVSANFGNLSFGTLSASRFKTAGTPLADGNAVFLYDGTSGVLSFDADGNGSGAAATIATLTGSKTLIASDIWISAS